MSGFWKCSELKLESKWLSSALRPFHTDINKVLRTRHEFDAFVRHECPGGISIPLVSSEFCDLLTAILKNCPSQSELANLNSLQGLRLEQRIPGYTTFIDGIIEILRRVMGYQRNFGLSYSSSFAIRYDNLVRNHPFQHQMYPSDSSNTESKKKPLPLVSKLKLMTPPVPIDYSDRTYHTPYSYAANTHHFEHSDNCDITINLNIGETFTGGHFLLAARKYDQHVPPYELPAASPFGYWEQGSQIHMSTSTDIRAGDARAPQLVPSYNSPRLYVCHDDIITRKLVHYDDLKPLSTLLPQVSYQLSTLVKSAVDRHSFALRGYTDIVALARRNYFRYGHVRGQALLHAGRQLHATLPVISGARLNIIMFINTYSSFIHWHAVIPVIQLSVLSFLHPIYDLMSYRQCSRACHTQSHDTHLWKDIFVRYARQACNPEVDAVSKRGIAMSQPMPPVYGMHGVVGPVPMVVPAAALVMNGIPSVALATTMTRVPPSRSAVPQPPQPIQHQYQQQQQQQAGDMNEMKLLSASAVPVAIPAASECEASFAKSWVTARLVNAQRQSLVENRMHMMKMMGPPPTLGGFNKKVAANPPPLPSAIFARTPDVDDAARPPCYFD